MDLNKCLLSGILLNDPKQIENELGSFLEFRIDKTEEITLKCGRKISSVIQCVILYWGKMTSYLKSLKAGVRIYIEGTYLKGDVFHHSSDTVFLSKTIHLL